MKALLLQTIRICCVSILFAVSLIETGWAQVTYSVSQSGTYNIEIDNPTYITIDPDGTTLIPIGFDFKFFGTTYTECYISQNGFISFDDSGGGCCEGQSLPDANAPNNLIAPAWTDMDFYSVHYEVFGTAPDRRLVITFDYEDFCGADYYGQVKLYETTNVIEIHTQEWASTAFPCENTTQGIENADGSLAYYAPGRNANTDWYVDDGDEDFVGFYPQADTSENSVVYMIDQTGTWDPEYDYPEEVTVPENGYSGPISIGFDFVFYGDTVNTVWMAQDGFITFSTPGGGQTSDPQTLPDPSAPNNLIAGLWTDLDATDCEYGGCYTYEVLGDAPNRRFLASYGLNTMCGEYIETQIKLFETSNIVEIHSYYENYYNCDVATQGIENSNGTAATFIADRNNNSSWSAYYDYVAFIPLQENDAGIYANIETYCDGPQDIVSIVKNFGSNVIDSLTLNWTWNGVPQTPIATLFPMYPDGSYGITLGPQTLTFGEEDTLVVWTSDPNGMSDPNTTNDTVTTVIHPGMHGVYTIGGTDPDYATFADAIADLENIGVCDSTIFDVRPGTYTEQILVNHIPGAFGDSKVIFRAENGDSSSVIVQFSASDPGYNYVVKFNNAHNIVLENLTLTALGATYARVLDLTLYSFDNIIRNCAINGHSSSSTSTTLACIYSEANNPNNEISQNTISNGSYGFYHQPFGADAPTGLEINNNTFLNQSYYGLFSDGTRGLRIYRNTFISNATAVRGIDISNDTDTLNIYGNYIHLENGYRGISISQVTPVGGHRAQIANNMVAIPYASANAGIGVYNSNATDIIHNSVLISSALSATYAIYHVSGVQDSIFNNIFANTGGGPIVGASSVSTNYFDYNDYYGTGQVFGVYTPVLNGAEDIHTWTALTGYDTHSLVMDPLFDAADDLHVSNTYLNGRGSPAFATAVDFDLEPRNQQHPDIGADEFTPPANDAAIQALLSPAGVCTEEQNVEVVLINLGADSLHSVTIHWSVDSIEQDSVLATPELAPEGDTAHIVIGTYVFGNQPDTIVVWSALPNGSADLLLSNDTLTQVYRLPLNGTYTIGGTAPDFITLQAAADALKSYTICGPVEFRLRDGTYTEQVVIDSIQGSSTANTITFTSESGDSSAVSIEFNDMNSNKNYVIELNGTDYVTFRNLGFKALNVLNGDIIDAINGVTHLTLEHNYFEGPNYGGSTSRLVNTFNAGINEDFIIRDNYFLNGQQGVYLYSVLGPEIRPQNILIEQNSFINQRNRGVSITGTRTLTIRDNFVETNTTANGYIGIAVENSNILTEVSGNQVIIDVAGDGMYLNTMNFGLGVLGISKVYNNMVSTASGIGINIWNSTNVHVYFNNAFTAGTNATGHHAFELVSGDTIDVKDNVFVANAGRAFQNILVTPPVVTSDYNDLVTAGSTLGQWNNVAYADLPAWQSGTGFDTSSKSIDPQFVSTTDLHVLADTLDGAGIPAGGIAEDFDGDSRNVATPDIGADEIGTNENDAGAFAVMPAMPFARGNEPLRAVIRNYGSNTITSVEVHWTLNGIDQTTYDYTGTLPTLTQDTVVLDTINFVLATPYDFKVWTAMPNMVTDLYHGDDTVSVTDLYAAVSDTVTIGGVAPDVADVESALTALLLGGILDSVHFQLRNGTYSASITIPQSPSLTCSTPVYFESESGAPADVILNNTGFSGHALTLDGADGLTFRNLTIQSTSSSYHALEVRNEANCNTFDNCVIEVPATTSTNVAQSVIYSSGYTDTANVFVHNTILNGSYGVYWDGVVNETGTRFEDNTVTDPYYTGMYVRRQSSPVLRGNVISSANAYSNFTGMYLITCNDAIVVRANQILLPEQHGEGIHLNSCYATALKPGVIANNFVIVGQSSASVGIDLSGTAYEGMFYNTVLITGTSTGSHCTYVHGTSNTLIQNNIFSDQSGGTAMRLLNESEVITCDYNDLLTTGATLVQSNTGTYADLGLWQGTGFDLHSLSVDPQFADSLDFHVLSSFLDGAATPLPEVTEDIEGDPRDTLTPDIGADEFNLFTNDVGILSINYPKEPFPPGENTVFIKFVNNGQDTLTTMQVDWQVNNIPQPTYFWTGLLPSAGTYDSLDIGSYDFSPYQPYHIKVWVSNPNGLTDELASNDTLQVQNLYPGLIGVYTIGGTTPDFDSLGQAVNALMLGGAAGAVTFNVRSGTYLETMNIGEFPGCGCSTPVTFQSESGDSTNVTITNLGIDDNIITLDGADGLIFKHLTLTSVNPAYRRVIEYFNGAHCNQFLNNRIIGYEGTSTSLNDAVIWSNTSLDTADVFRNNWIRYGAYGFYLVGNGSANSNTIIENNFLDQNYYCGISATQELGIQILSNDIIVNTNTAKGLNLSYCDNGMRIMGNTVQVPNGQYGAYLSSCTGSPAGHDVVANNFFSTGGTNTAYGILATSCSDLDIYHNSTNVYSSTGSSTNNAALRITDCASVNILNNILNTQSPGPAYYSDNNSGFSSDYNDIAWAGSSLGFWNGAEEADLSAWQAASGGDANSFSSNPQYMSDVDLHVTNILLHNSGTPGTGITTDIDGDTRDAMPDIGADEFQPVDDNDAGIFMLNGPVIPFAAGIQPVEVAIKNYGLDTLTSVTVHWVVNGLEQTPFSWSGAAAPAQCAFATIGNFDFAEHTKHDMIFWTELPNGVPDSTHINDTLAINDFYPALNGLYTVGGVLPDFNLFSQLEQALNKGGILGNVTFHIRSGSYSMQLRIGNFPRISQDDLVTFTSESGDSSTVTLERDFGSSQNYTVGLFDAHQITFSHLTMSSTQGRILEISNGSSRVNVDHCRFMGVPVTYPTGEHQLIYSATTTEDSISITYSRFERGDYGIYLIGSAGDPEKDDDIVGNTFINCFYRSAHLHNHDGLVFDKNVVINNLNAHQGIAFTACINTRSISGNDIRLYNGGTWGLYMHYVSGNSETPALISNNYILIQGGSLQTYGIYHSNGNYNNFDYNTVRIESTDPDSRAFTDESSYHNINLRNCVFANLGGGKTLHVSWPPGYHTNTMDYCDLYSTGPVLAYWSGDRSDLAALQAYSGLNGQSVSQDPLFLAEDYHPLQAALDNSGTPVDSVTTDIEGEARSVITPDIGADEFMARLNDIGASVLISPATYCGLSDTEHVVLQIQNYSSNPQSGFDVAYSLDGAPWVVENVGGLSVPAGGILDYTFAPTEDLSVPGTYHFIVRTSLTGDEDLSNDTLHVDVEHIPALTDSVTNMIPAQGEMGLESAVPLSWAPAQNATVYDVYIWQMGDAQPVDPQVANLPQINTLYNGLNYGTTYNWRVVAKNSCDQMVPGSIQQFTVRHLPDLVVDTVIAPATAYSGETIQVEWHVRNQGSGGTQSQLWSDAVFLSTDATLNTSFDIYLGAVQNLTALDSGITYAQNNTFMIPNGISGNYYVFVHADRWNSLLESNNTNNWERTAGQMMISLPPTPDLKVESVVAPQNTFSGQSIPITATIKNIGTGPTQVSSWQDRVFYGSDPLNYAGGQLVATFQHNSVLDVDSTYQLMVNVPIPINEFGQRYIYVVTDFNNTVFENASESNNIGISDTINVVLTPPPDLFALDLQYPDTVSNNQTVALYYSSVNQGGSTITNTSWYDQVYLSPSPVYNTNFLTSMGTVTNYGPFAPFDTLAKSKSITIPVNATGPYYYYVYLDKGQYVFEYTLKSNNIVRSPGTFVILNPDLRVADISYPDSAIAGQQVSVQWNLINDGPGDILNRSWFTKVYLSTSSEFDEQTATYVQVKYQNINVLQAGDTLVQNASFTIPDGISGPRYVHIFADATSQIFENGEEADNVGTSLTPIEIALPPYPDLTSREIAVPDTVVAGQLLSLMYASANIGSVNATAATTDSFYLSFSPVWDPISNKVLGRRADIPALAAHDSILFDLMLGISTAQTSNVYYVYIKSDATSKVFEGSGESNNIQRSDPFFVKPAPPVDLHVDTLTGPLDTLYSGTPAAFSWTVRNESLSQAAASGWYDALYLSVDSVYDRYLDILFSETEAGVGGLGYGQTYTINKTPTLPDGISGDYYVIAVADDRKINNDPDSLDNQNTLRENGQATPVHIALSASPDLIPVQFDAPASAFSGQPFDIQWSIQNNGNSAALSWTDKIYLSADNVINDGDILLASETHTGANLQPGNQLQDTVNVYVGSQFTGNYILILQTDADNLLYEHLGEGNNKVSRSISFSTPPPADLTVTSIMIPDSVFAGSTISINWNTENIGANPANGVMREIAYLSDDTDLDANDQVFGLSDASLYIPPGNSVARSLTASVSGVADGNYYALVQTDALDNITESNDTNNIGASADLMNVSIEELYLDSLTMDSIYNGHENYFKLFIPYSDQGQTLRISLDGDSLGLYTEMYLKYGTAPTEADYDARHLYAFAQDQELLLDGVQGGTYYLMLRGQTMHASGQLVSVLARIVDFELLDIHPSHAINRGQSTIELLGSQMDTLRRVYLVRDSTVRINAESIYKISSYRAYATFNLQDVPTGVYTVQAIRWDGKIAERVESFTITDTGEEPDLQLQMDYPEVVGRRNGPMKITIYMQNAGDADIIGKSFRFEAPWGNALARTYEDLISGHTETSLEIPVQGAFGPPGVLPPKAGNVVEIFAYTHPHPTFTLTPVED